MSAVLIRLHGGLHVLIDAADLDLVQSVYWTPTRGTCAHHRLNHYLQGRVDGQSVSLHRWLIRPAAPLVVDHINGDGLDNRRTVNLRPVTRSVNARNRIRGPAPLSLGQLPAGVPIVAQALQPTPRGYSRAAFERLAV